MNQNLQEKVKILNAFLITQAMNDWHQLHHNAFVFMFWKSIYADIKFTMTFLLVCG